MFVGELTLDGKIRPVRGILNVVETAQKHHFKRLIIPTDNYQQAQLIHPKDTEIIPCQNLRELWLILNGLQKPLMPIVVRNTETDYSGLIFDQIYGQTQAKRALTIALAGRHNILFYGPPGTGKSMLAHTIPSLLPEASPEEIVEMTKIQSLANNITTPCTERPFRTPHHSASRAALLGGADGAPGEITLAHHGVLFLDELPEFRRDFLEALRQPLEDKHINIATARQKITYPTDFILVAAMNPCPCGYYGSSEQKCTCSPSTLYHYQHKLSGPLLDRIDLVVNVPKIPSDALKTDTVSTREYETAKHQIQAALNTQINTRHKSNGSLSSFEITKQCHLTKPAQTMLDDASKKLQLSARAYFKLIKVAQTIADIEASATIQPSHISEAVQYRQIL